MDNELRIRLTELKERQVAMYIADVRELRANYGLKPYSRQYIYQLKNKMLWLCSCGGKLSGGFKRCSVCRKKILARYYKKKDNTLP